MLSLWLKKSPHSRLPPGLLTAATGAIRDACPSTAGRIVLSGIYARGFPYDPLPEPVEMVWYVKPFRHGGYNHLWERRTLPLDQSLTRKRCTTDVVI